MGRWPVAPTLSHHHSALPNDNNRDDYNRGPDFDHRGHYVNNGSGDEHHWSSDIDNQ